MTENNDPWIDHDLTRVIHGDDGVEVSRDIGPPLHLTSTFEAEGAAQFAEMATTARHSEYYTRYGNPTVSRVERIVADLEGAESALMFASGMGAISTAVLSLVSQGGHIVAQRNHYMGTTKLVLEFLPRFGVTATLVDQTDTADFEAALTPATQLILVESPANPTLQVTDLRSIAELARSHGIFSMADNTLASPMNQRPITLGLDLSMHAGTKYLGGHHDLVAGVVAGPSEMIERIWNTSIVLGATASPFDAWLLLRGLRTLPLRVRQHNESALAVARFLSGHVSIEHVHYPGLPGHAQHALASSQMSGFGGVMSFAVHGGYDRAQTVMSKLNLIKEAVSLGGFESLAVHAAAMWAGTLGEAGAVEAGVQPNLIRLSVGLEHESDIVADLNQALS
ncbi:methionine gamma-lyase [soil metagenome]